MSWWVAGTIVLGKAYEGYEAAKAGDKSADAIEDLIPSTLLASRADKIASYNTSMSKTLHTKDVISGEISNTRIQSKIGADKVLAETSGSGVLADTGSTLDTQMAVLNEGRRNESRLMAQMSIERARNAWESQKEREAIDRHTGLEVARLRAKAKATRDAGKQAKSQAFLGGILGGIASYGRNYKSSPETEETEVEDPKDS